jgi:DUF4097 and DUF4098 domain-containing protein YvlB
MRRTIYVALCIVTVASPKAYGQRNEWEQCKHEAARSATVDAAGARLLDLEAGSGSLKVIGKPGLKSVVIRGKACASSADLLNDIELDARRSGSNVVVSANVQDNDNHRGWRNNEYARLDIVVEVPQGMDADIDDGSGEVELTDLGAVTLHDGSGEITADRLTSARITDGSGEISLSDVGGRVDIKDGSGEITLRNIDGAIDIHDGSGEIKIRNAKNSVRISDSSGGIDVVDVGGDFIVDDDGSGGIEYDNVRGKIDIPRKKSRDRD